VPTEGRGLFCPTAAGPSPNSKFQQHYIIWHVAPLHSVSPAPGSSLLVKKSGDLSLPLCGAQQFSSEVLRALSPHYICVRLAHYSDSPTVLFRGLGALSICVRLAHYSDSPTVLCDSVSGEEHLCLLLIHLRWHIMRTWFLEELPLMYSQSLIIQPSWGGILSWWGTYFTYVWLDMRCLWWPPCRLDIWVSVRVMKGLKVTEIPLLSKWMHSLIMDIFTTCECDCHVIVIWCIMWCTCAYCWYIFHVPAPHTIHQLLCLPPEQQTVLICSPLQRRWPACGRATGSVLLA